MLFLGRKKKEKKKEPERTPVWFKWMLGGFMAYAIIYNIVSGKPLEQIQEIKEVEQRRNTHGLIFNFERLSPLLNNPTFMVAEDQKEGGGEIASCWDEVGVHYELFNSRYELQDTIASAEEPLMFNIGKNEVLPAIEAAVPGMREGGVRVISASPLAAFGAEGFDHPAFKPTDLVGIRLWLDKVNQLEVDQSAAYKVLDSKDGKGPAAGCADEVVAALKLTNARGEVIFDTTIGSDLLRGLIREKNVFVKIGEGKWPYGIERGLLGIQEGGERTVLMPGAWLRPATEQKLGSQENLIASFLKRQDIPENELVIVEIIARRINFAEQPH